MDQIKLLAMPEVLGVSSIATACTSLKHYHWNKVLERREETPAMREGTQLHMLVLEPEKFYASYCTDLDIPEGETALKTVEDIKRYLDGCNITSYKKSSKKEDLANIARDLIAQREDKMTFIYDDWVEMHTRDKEFISKTKWLALHEMKASVMAHDYMKVHFPNAKTEVQVEGEIDGVNIRGRLDFLVDDPALPIVLVMDVKKCRSAEYWPLNYVIKDMKLHVQAALYIKMLEDRYKKPVAFVWLFTEGKWPYITECYECDAQMAETGLILARQAVRRIRKAYETDSWPGYTGGKVNHMSLSEAEYAKADDIERMMQAEDDGTL